MDGMGAHGIDMVMAKKSNLEFVFPEKWACLVFPVSHFFRFSPNDKLQVFGEASKSNSNATKIGKKYWLS